jgi:hypothetical protein
VAILYISPYIYFHKNFLKNIMISREFGQPLNDANLLQANAIALKYKNLMALPIPILYRFSELQILQAWERPGLIAAARAHAMSQWSVRLVLYLCAVLAVGLAYYFISTQQHASVLWVWLSTVLILAPARLLRRYKMQLYVREQVLNRKRQDTLN